MGKSVISTETYRKAKMVLENMQDQDKHIRNVLLTICCRYEGKNNKEIGQNLCVSRQTVSTYITKFRENPDYYLCQRKCIHTFESICHANNIFDDYQKKLQAHFRILLKKLNIPDQCFRNEKQRFSFNEDGKLFVKMFITEFGTPFVKHLRKKFSVYRIRPVTHR